jgi:hypothetical protein
MVVVNTLKLPPYAALIWKPYLCSAMSSWQVMQ